jgi:hypothetical protein
MTKFLNGQMNQQEEEGRRRRQQQQREAAARMELIDPPRYESVAHQVSAIGGIQINHTENGTQVITESQHAYAESVPESSVTEDFETTNALTEDGQEQQQHGKTRDGKGEELDNDASFKISASSKDRGSASRPSSATESIHVRDVNTGSDIQITGDGIHIREGDGSEVHVKTGTGNRVHGSSPGVMVYGTASNYRGNGYDSSYRIYNTGRGHQINGNVYGHIY